MLKYISKFSSLLLLLLAGTFLCCSHGGIDEVLYDDSYQIGVIAHRGYWEEEGCQNSLESIHLAAHYGVDGIEFDVRVTQDDSVIVFHDASIYGRAISQTCFSQLREVKLSNGEQIPTLYEFLRVASEYPNLDLFIELKTTYSIPKVLAIVEKAQLKNHIVFISFMKNALQSVFDILPDAELGYIRRNGQDDFYIFESQTHYSYLVYQIGLLDDYPLIIEMAEEKGLYIIPWLIDNVSDFNRAIKFGAKYVITNNPQKIITHKK